jgi:hypothetical protein
MPLVQTNTATPATVLNNIGNTVKQQWRQHFQAWKQSVLMIWKNGRGFTPAQMVDQLGTTAVGVFQASAATEAYLAAQSANPALFDAATNTANQALIAGVLAIIGPFTANADGSITVTSPATP